MPFQYGQTREQRRIRHNVRIGSFEGGVNRLFYRNALLMPNNQVVDCVNLDPLENGLLRSRVGIKGIVKTTNFYTASSGYTQKIIGFLDTLGPVLHEKNDTTGTIKLRYPTTDPTAATVGTAITPVATTQFNAYVRYNDLTFLVPSHATADTGPVFINGLSGASLLNPATTTSLPAGDHAFMWKSRMWVIDKTYNRIYWSKVSDPTVWAAPDGGYIDMKDTEDTITSYAVTTDALYIFKKRSTYQITYNVDPGTDIYVRTVSSSQGAYNAISHKGVIYTFDSKGVYKFLNNVFYELSSVLNFKTLYIGVDDAGFQLGNLAILNDLLLLTVPVTGISGSATRIPVLNTKTGAWTFYDTASLNGNIQIRLFKNYNYIANGADLWYALGTTNDLDPGNTDYCDTSTAGYDIFPAYSFITKPQDLAYPDIWKRVHSLKMNGNRQSIAASDSQYVTISLILEEKAPTDFNGQVVSTATLITASYHSGVQERVPVNSFRAHMFALSVAKAKASPLTTGGVCYFEFSHFTGDISYKGESFSAG